MDVDAAVDAVFDEPIPLVGAGPAGKPQVLQTLQPCVFPRSQGTEPS